VSRLDIGNKPDDVKFPEITKGFAYFVPPPGKSLDVIRLHALLKESGYKLRSVRIELDGIVNTEQREIRVPDSGQVFALDGSKQLPAGRVRMVGVWNSDHLDPKNPPREVKLNVESISSLK
jgi:hypothetical protein